MKRFIHTIVNLIAALLIMTGLFIGVCLFLSFTKEDFDFEGLTAVRSVDDFMDWYKGESMEAMLGEPVVVESVSYDRYVYQTLSEEEQETYDQVYDCIINFKDKITLSTKDKDVLAKAYEGVMADYGNLFWISGYQYNTYASGNNIIGLEFEPKYTMNEEQRDIYQVKIDSVVSEWLYGINPEAGDFEKALYVFETLIEKVDYDADSQENQNILSVFIYQSTVCQGYADAAWYLLDQLGIKSTIVTGTANNESHAWNLVYLDDAYYYMDVTWGDASYQTASGETADASKLPDVNYAYLNVTTSEILLNHKLSDQIELPYCSSSVDNYYVREGEYFTSAELTLIKELFDRKYNEGSDNVTIKCSSQAVYDAIFEEMVTNRKVFDYLQGDTSQVAYTSFEETRTIIFWL